jgi:hypothetical protein
MKWPITLVATVLLSSARVSAAQGGVGATSEDFLGAPPRAEQASDLRAPAVAESPARTIAVVWVLMMMTVIACRRLGRRAP